MLIKKITLNNIRSYKNQEIEFPDGSILLSGDIGSGKTSVLLAIEFALFGLQPGQRGNSLLRNGENQGGVIIELEVEGVKIIIERTLKKSKTISQDYCAITIDNQKKEMSVMELKDKILEILNYPKEFAKKQNILYKFTVYTPQEEMKQIILQDSQTRLNTLRHVFGIDKYKRILENISIVSSKIREEKRISEALTANLEQEKINIATKKDELNEKNSQLGNFEQELLLKIEKRKKIKNEKDELTKKIEEKNKFSQEIEKTKLTLSHKKDTMFSNNKSINEIQNQIEELNKLSFDFSRITRLEQKIIESKEEKEKLNEKIININSRISSIHLKNEDIIKIEQKLSDLEVCPTCLQTVEAIYRANVLNNIHNDLSLNKRRLEELEAEKNNFSKQSISINSEINSCEKEIGDLRILNIRLQGINEKQAYINQLRNSKDVIEKDIELLNQHLEVLSNSVSELIKFDRIFDTVQKELEESLRQEKLSEIKLAELRKEIELFSKQIEDLSQRIKQTEEIHKKLDYLNELENWLSKKFAVVISYIEKNVMIKLQSKFSRLFAEWFSMLVLDSFNVGIRDDFTPIIEQHDYEIDYAYLSGGERTAIALAYRLALNQVINSMMSKIKTKDLVILDEPTDGFSDQQLDKMRDVLQELDVKQLIIVSHEQKIESFVENVIKFKKDGGISRME